MKWLGGRRLKKMEDYIEVGERYEKQEVERVKMKCKTCL
jgi:hypothetical protein